MIDLEERVTDVPPPPSAPKVPSWLGLVGLLGLGLVLVLAGYGWTVLAISTLLTIVLLHELGHFVTAKATGMKATEFFLGFGPRLWSFRRGETEYGIKLLPLGGYVRIVGFTSAEEVDPSDEPRVCQVRRLRQSLQPALQVEPATPRGQPPSHLSGRPRPRPKTLRCYCRRSRRCPNR